MLCFRRDLWLQTRQFLVQQWWLWVKKKSYGDKDKIIVVIKEIESWYLAGLDNEVCRQLKINNFADTDNVTKEKFNALIPKKFTSRIDFMLEILKNFSIEIAKQKNNSFRYFVEKYV